MSYIPNIQGLRFVERDGKKILQQLSLKQIDEGTSIYGGINYEWIDVPMEGLQ